MNGEVRKSDGNSPLNFHWQWSLKTQLTVFTLAMFLIIIWALTYNTSAMLRRDMQFLVGEQLSSTAALLAAEINQSIDDRIKALETVAGGITEDHLHDTAVLQAFLEKRPVFQSLFNGGTFVTGIDGIATASVPSELGRVGVDYSDRDFILSALRERKAVVGKPVIGKKLGVPIFAIAVPVRDLQGRVIGAIAGVTDLNDPNFLDQVTRSHYGKTGGYLLVARKYRLIVMATNKSRIMAELPDPGINPIIDGFLRGTEGTFVYVNPLGVEQLASVKDIPVADWYVNVTLPTAEAFAPIRAVQERVLLASALFTLLGGSLIWWVTLLLLRRQLKPILTTTRILVTLSESDGIPRELPVSSHDEIGELIGGFNQLLRILREREAALQESELRYRTVADFTWDWEYWVIPDDSFRYMSPSCEQVSGYSRDEFYADPQLLNRIVHPDDLPHYYEHRHGGSSEKMPKAIDYRIRTKEGEYRWVSHVCRVVFDFAGQPNGYRASNRDITDRKLVEEEVRRLAFHDALTTLPNRRLLHDRLIQNMAAYRRSGHYGALLFLDLDNFKPLNDRHGHDAGDLLLIEVASRLKKSVRAMDTVARFGGDEFVVMLDELDTDKLESISQARIVADKIHRSLAEPYLLMIGRGGDAGIPVEHRCSACIGVAMFSGQEGSPDDIINSADAAMYGAKEGGRNQIRFHE